MIPFFSPSPHVRWGMSLSKVINSLKRSILWEGVYVWNDHLRRLLWGIIHGGNWHTFLLSSRKRWISITITETRIRVVVAMVVVILIIVVTHARKWAILTYPPLLFPKAHEVCWGEPYHRTVPRLGRVCGFVEGPFMLRHAYSNLPALPPHHPKVVYY